jgi:hypothetical protein
MFRVLQKTQQYVAMVYLLVLLWLDGSSVMGLRFKVDIPLKYLPQALDIQGTAARYKLGQMLQNPETLQKEFGKWAPALFGHSSYRVVTYEELQNSRELPQFKFTPCTSGDCKGRSSINSGEVVLTPASAFKGNSLVSSRGHKVEQSDLTDTWGMAENVRKALLEDIACKISRKQNTCTAAGQKCWDYVVKGQQSILRVVHEGSLPKTAVTSSPCSKISPLATLKSPQSNVANPTKTSVPELSLSDLAANAKKPTPIKRTIAFGFSLGATVKDAQTSMVGNVHADSDTHRSFFGEDGNFARDSLRKFRSDVQKEAEALKAKFGKFRESTASTAEDLKRVEKFENAVTKFGGVIFHTVASLNTPDESKFVAAFRAALVDVTSSGTALSIALDNHRTDPAMVLKESIAKFTKWVNTKYPAKIWISGGKFRADARSLLSWMTPNFCDSEAKKRLDSVQFTIKIFTPTGESRDAKVKVVRDGYRC